MGRKVHNLTGMRFGKLLVISQAETHIKPSGVHVIMWNCICDCGNKYIARAGDLVGGKTKSCGCISKITWTQNFKTTTQENLIGKRFGKLSVVDNAEPYIDNGYNNTAYMCLCDCGKMKRIRATSLKQGLTTSCGCYRSVVNKQRTWKRIREQPQQKFGKLKVVGEAEDYIYPNGDRATQVKCICDCGKEITVMARYLLRGSVTSCGCRTQSIGEERIEQYLIDNNVKYLSEVSFPFCVNPETGASLRFDFALIDNDKSGTVLCAIEYQGIQHYEDCGEFGRLEREKTDKIKKSYCEKNNLPLYEIRYDEDEIKAIETIVSQYRR